MTDRLPDPQFFPSAADFAAWLQAHHAITKEVWVRIYKGASSVPSVRWEDCVVEALRFGWIDGQRRAFDAASFIQRLTPRKPKSNWSARNREHALRLIAEGRMMPAGLAQVAAAQADGRWDAAYAGSAGMTMPKDFLGLLAERPVAAVFFETLDRGNRYAIYYRLQTAKRPQTRAKRLAEILDRLDRGERLR